MILAAGYGSRLRPLTSHLPKPLVPILNRPLLWYLIASLRAAGIREIIINLHYQGQQIRTWLGRGEQLGVAVTYSEESVLLGSAGGLRHVRDFFGDEPALVVHGDILYDVDLGAVIQYHLSRKAHVTIVLHPAYQRYRYGLIKVNAHGEIGQFADQHAPWVAGPFTDTVFTGVQILEPMVLDAIDPASVGALTTDVYPRLLSDSSRFYGYLMQGYWSDIGTPQRYWEANMDLLSARVIPAGMTLHSEHSPAMSPQAGWVTRVGFHPPIACPSRLTVEGDSSIGPGVVLGEGCELAAGVSIVESVLWPRVRVGAGVIIDRSIIANDITIPPGMHLVGKIVSSAGVSEL